MGSPGLWLRWSWRDFRQRWLLVVAIALVIALGTGTWAAFTGSSTWRRESNDASFAALDTHDLRVRLAAGTTTRQGSLLAALDTIPSAGAVTSAEERLVLPMQVEALGAGEDLLVTGEIVGTGTPRGGEVVDDLFISSGRGLTPADAGKPVVVLERNFAEYYDLPASGRLRVSGGQPLTYVGHGQSPETLLVTGEGGTGFFTQSTYAVLFSSLPTAQAVGRAPGRVNDLVLTLQEGVDPEQVKAELERALADAPSAMSGTVTTRAEMPAYRLLYDDIDSDQKVWNVVAGLVLAGAAFAAFNLTGRIVEAQRREIGVGMALGVSRPWLALRPLLLGVQVAVLGVVLGVVVGLVIGEAFAGQLRSLLPLPVWDTAFQPAAFARGAVLGFVIPMVAVVWPVWRAVRVEPVDAIRVGHLAGRGRAGGMAPLLRRVPLVRSTLRQMPFRNVLRTPRRTVLTALGIGAAITTLVSIFGMLDSFGRALQDGRAELTRGSPDRVTVQLLGLEQVGSSRLSEVTKAPGVAAVSAGLSLPATVRTEGHDAVDIQLETVGHDAVWRPSVVDGHAPDDVDEILLAEKAARDLGVGPGDRVMVTHPRRVGPDAYRSVTTVMTVAGTHPDPLRVPAYVDDATARSFGMEGLANVVQVVPAPGVATTDVQRAMFRSPTVASAQPVTVAVDALDEALQQFTAILVVAAGVVLVLALLIAFNASSIAVDERARENATMVAFGVPVRGLLGIQTVESALTGLLGTLFGLAAGFWVLSWFVGGLLAETTPEFGVPPVLSPGTVAIAFSTGVLAVALAPLLTVRRLRRMDVPSALRVIE